jgi:DNA-binding MarR family transcriptional regulator
LPRRHGAPSIAPAAGQTLSPFESVLSETVALFHRLRAVAEQIHRQGAMSAGRRGVLKYLERLGPQTVPQMARARPVSRQHIQTLVNQLAADGLVELSDNPAHKRSRLVRLTPQGKALAEGMNRREAALLSRLKVDIPEQDLRAASAVLRAVQALFESGEWERLLREAK